MTQEKKLNSQFDYQAVVIGSGPGGYVCAIKLGQLGVKTAIIEKESLGGVCLNVGCIPSKALIHAGTFYEKMQHHSSELGIKAKVDGIDLATLKSWKDKIVKKLTSGVQGLLKANGVDIFEGMAQFQDAHTLQIKNAKGEVRSISAQNIVIATGSRSTIIPGFEPDGKKVITSTEALDLTQIPPRMVVIGGGYIGLELGTYYSKVGSQVTVLEGGPQPLASMDAECVNVVLKKLQKRNIEIITNAKAKSYRQTQSGALEVLFETPQGTQKKECDVILVTVGRSPQTQGLGLEKARLKVNAKGFLDINPHFQTQVPHIYAIGDVAGGMLLAHKASREGILCAEVIHGAKNRTMNTKVMPAVVFTDPEIASVGYTLKEAQAAGFAEAKEAVFPFAALGKALASSETDGFAKYVFDSKTKKILGVHIVGAEASSLLGEGSLALEMGAVLEDLALTIHAHPTLPEVLMEAAEVGLGHPIHIVKKK